MPMPRFMAHVNKRTFNKLTLRRGASPVLIHTGRRSGRTLFTPLDAIPVERGYIFFVIYGRRSDWVRNVLAAGSAQLSIDGKTIDLTAPRLIPRNDARPLLPPGTSEPPDILRVSEYLRMDVASGGDTEPR
jgi:deazaflavin-dependent oxidoreductase (nitroreductase family)